MLAHTVWAVLASVPDPEIPILSIVDLGIVRHVVWAVPGTRQATSGTVRVGGRSQTNRPVPHVGITPTYSGCPATEIIRDAVRAALDREGYSDAILEEVLSPPWTSDWITEEGRQKLESFGIAPPAREVSSPRQLFRASVVACPRCGSQATERISEFGSTPCKAHYRCTACLEPFDYFKCL